VGRALIAAVALGVFAVTGLVSAVFVLLVVVDILGGAR